MEVYTVEEHCGPDEGYNLVHVASTPELAEQWVVREISKPIEDWQYQRTRDDFLIVTWKV